MRLPDGQNQPICAGVLITDGSDVLFTLGTHDRWSRGCSGRLQIPVTGVGGGQMPGETMQECAMREAHEEILCSVNLIDSRITYFESETGTIDIVTCANMPAPLLYQIQRRHDSRPFGPSLPSGDLLHIGIFRAISRLKPAAGDVPALLWIPWDRLYLLSTNPSISFMQDCGARLITASMKLPMSARLILPEQSTERLLIDLVKRFGVRVIKQ